MITSHIDYAFVPSHFTFAHVKGLTLQDLKIANSNKNPAFERHAVFMVNTQDVNIRGLSGTQNITDGNLATINLTDCQNVFLTGCQAIPGNKSFLRLEGQRSKNVSVIGNDISVAKIAFEFEKEILKNALFQTANRLPLR